MFYLVSPNDDRNYGAVLQATALQHAMECVGIKTEFITIRRNLNQVAEYDLSSIKAIIKSFFVLVHRKKLLLSCDRFDAFVQANQHVTTTFESYSALEQAELSADGFLVGSDQVWPMANLLPLNFLSFARKKTLKYSYAASTGTDLISEESKEFFRTNLRDFSEVSIREKDAEISFREVYDGSLTVNVDPTLLFDMDYWQTKEIEYISTLPDKYILAYMIYVPKDINAKLKSIKKYTNLPIVFVSNTAYKSIWCDYYIRDAGPGEFLWLVHHAEGIISSSYHGNIFSLVYNKPFLCVNNPNKPTRLKCLLETFGIAEFQEWNRDFISNNRDVLAKIKPVLDNEKQKAFDYFKRIKGQVESGESISDKHT